MGWLASSNVRIKGKAILSSLERNKVVASPGWPTLPVRPMRWM